MTRSIPDRTNKYRRVQTPVNPESLTEQQHGEACNINTIMRKLRTQGELPHFSNGGNFGDFTTYDDYHTMKNRILQANEDFMALPSELRHRFHNDPGNLLTFLEDPGNRAEAIVLGLIAPSLTPATKSPQESVKDASEEPTAEDPPKTPKAPKGPKSS